MGLALLGLGIWQAFDRWSATNGVSVIAQIAPADVDEPDETKPDTQTTAYEVPADHPRRIVLNSLGVDGFVQQVGLTSKNAVGVPANIHVAGWFNETVLPGQKGLSIIDGHVTGIYNDGIFVGLMQMKPGDTFEVEYGDRSKKTFEVVDVRKMPESESAKFLFERDQSINAQLNLITCGGDFDTQADQYVDRVVVVSKLIE